MTSSDDEWVIYLIGIFGLGFFLSLAGYIFLAWLGLFGIERQLYIFGNIQMVTNIIQTTVHFLILPVYILVVGSIGAYILHKTEWSDKDEDSQ